MTARNEMTDSGKQPMGDELAEMAIDCAEFLDEYKEPLRIRDGAHKAQILRVMISYALHREQANAQASTPADVPEWRCFGCGFETSNYEEALAHFGDLGEEVYPLCVTWSQLDADGRASELQAQIIERNAVERENTALRTSNEGLEYRTHAEQQSIRTYKPFAKCNTINDVFFVYDSMEGEKLAAIERAEAAESRCKELAAQVQNLIQYSEHYSGTEDCIANLESRCKELREALQGLEAAFMSHTQWNGEPPSEVVAARKALSGE